MDTKYLSYILTIAKKENMTKAAEELFVSQSTLSQYLSKLESELGTPLFYRSKGRLTLTAAGRLYIDASEKVMAIKDNLYQNIQNLDNRGHMAHVLRREEIFFAIPRTHPYCRINPGRPVTIPEFARYFSEDNILMSKKGSTLRCLTDQIIETAGWIHSHYFSNQG